MTLDSYYYITSLPALGELGTEPPIDFVELRDHLADDPDRRKLVNCPCLLDDLLQRESYLAGELQTVAPAVLSEKQTRDESPLPEFLLPEVHQDDNQVADSTLPTGGRCRADDTWEAYFRHVAAMTRRFQCDFLAAWVRHEVALRNALTSIRAQKLGLDESDYLVATDLTEVDERLSEVASDWQSAPTPLAGQQTLIRARWDWLAEHDRYFTFRDDELAAYAVRLMLLKEWRRIGEQD